MVNSYKEYRNAQRLTEEASRVLKESKPELLKVMINNPYEVIDRLLKHITEEANR